VSTSISYPTVARAAETASNCIECGEYEEKCPYRRPIRELIKENYEFFKKRVDGDR